MPRILWLTLMLPVACDNKDPNNSSDADGDGYPIDEDCNDSDPSIYPGAEETWYDGVDTDCQQDDDYDADADGSRDASGGGTDCDDSDPSIYPGAEETWYDGVDADCAGDNDYDADADGYEADAQGGDDCDDGNPDVYVGAEETWYDGVDADCAGDNDFDADADGYEADTEGGDDCDDNDDESNPSAEETWYDGVDADCAGDNDYDADADGYEADGYGGQDCDDNNDTIWPDADEVIDGEDNNCDGTDDDFQVDDSYGGLSIQGSDASGGAGAALAAGDIDGDSLADIAILQTSDLYYSDSGGGAVHVLLNASLQSSTSVSSATYQIVADSDSGSLDGVWFISDIESDGGAELLIASTDSMQNSSTIGRVGLFTSSEMSSTVQELSEAGRLLEGDGGDFGAEVASWPDIDGDGIDELVVAAPDHDAGVVYLWFSDELSSSGTMLAEDAVTLSGVSSGDELGAGMVGMVDINGDGYGELVIGAPGANNATGEVYLIPGDPSQASGLVNGQAWMTLIGGDEDDRTGEALTVGDINGDGAEDLIVTASAEDTRAGRVHVVLGSDLTSGTRALADIDHVSYGGASINGYAGRSVASGGDIDGDGKHDLIIGGPGNSNGSTDAGEAWAVVSGESGDRALVNATSSFYGTANEQAGSSVGMADINNDGLFDLLIGVPGESTLLSGEGAIYIGISSH